MYNQFLGETLAEQVRIGKTKTPNELNPITVRKKQLLKQIESQSRELGRPKYDIALDYVISNTGDIQKYVLSKNEQPLSNPAELSMQAYLLRKKEVERVAKTMGVSFKEAETYLEQSESNTANLNSAEADNFLGAIFGAIGNVVEGIADKQVAKRTASGKKPGFWGTVSKLAGGGNANTAINTTGADGGNLKFLAQDVLDAIKKAETKKQVNKYLPMIIIGVIVLILLTILITKGASKKS